MHNKKSLLFIILLFVILPVISGCMPHPVDSTEVGIRVVNFSLFGKKGVVDKAYGPGTHCPVPKGTAAPGNKYTGPARSECLPPRR